MLGKSSTYHIAQDLWDFINCHSKYSLRKPHTQELPTVLGETGHVKRDEMSSPAGVYPHQCNYSWHFRWNRGCVNSVDNQQCGRISRLLQDTIVIQVLASKELFLWKIKDLSTGKSKVLSGAEITKCILELKPIEIKILQGILKQD